MKIINGFDSYFVSEDGKIFSLKRSNLVELKYSLTKYNSKNSYKRVCLSDNGKIKMLLVHRIVATEFVKNEENKPYVNHIDGNKYNNAASNLEWVSAKENIEHAIKTGLRDFSEWTEETKIKSIEKRRKTYVDNGYKKYGRSKLSNLEVYEIRKRFDNQENPSSICKDFPVDRISCYNIGIRKTYRHLE